MGGVTAVVDVILCESQGKDGVLRIEKQAFLLEFFNGPLIDLFNADEFFILFNRFVEGLLVELLTQFLLLQ